MHTVKSVKHTGLVCFGQSLDLFVFNVAVDYVINCLP